CGSLCPPSLHTWESVRAVPNHGQIVRNGFRLHAKLGDDPCFVAYYVAPAVQLNDSVSDAARAEILIRRANDYLPHPLIQRRPGCSGGERIIRFEFDHWPYDYSHCV